MLNEILIIFFLLTGLSFASHKPGDPPPKVSSQQYNSWNLQCIEDHGKKRCEVSQSLQIQNSNLRFSINYFKFKNKENEIKDIISIIAPLGVNLSQRLAIKFDNNSQINLTWTKCEVVGCMVILSNNTKDKIALEIYKRINDGFKKSKKAAIGVAGFAGKPLAIEINLNGFNGATKELAKQKL